MLSMPFAACRSITGMSYMRLELLWLGHWILLPIQIDVKEFVTCMNASQVHRQINVNRIRRLQDRFFYRVSVSIPKRASIKYRQDHEYSTYWESVPPIPRYHINFWHSRKCYYNVAFMSVTHLTNIPPS